MTKKLGNKKTTLKNILIHLGIPVLLGMFAGNMAGNTTLGVMVAIVIGVVIKVLVSKLNKREFITLGGFVSGMAIGFIWFTDVYGGVVVCALLGLIIGFFAGAVMQKEKI